MDIENNSRTEKAILMDNNILVLKLYGLQQIEKILKLGVKWIFNQGLDARLITDEIARFYLRK